jgi:hypothetical protein
MKNNLTLGQVDAICMAQAGNLAQNDIDIALRQAYINSKLMKLYRMLDGLNDPWYNKVATLTVAADQTPLKDTTNSSGSITSMVVSGSTVTIVDASHTFVAGTYLYISECVAGKIMSYQNIAIVTTGGALGCIATIIGTPNIVTFAAATHGLSIMIIGSPSSTAIDVSSLYFKEFTRISDENYTATSLGTTTRVFYPIKDEQLFAGLVTNPMRVKTVAWHQRGDIIQLFVGASANALGTVTGEYRGKPALYDDTTINNNVDIPPEDNQILIDEVVASFLIDKGKTPPLDVAGRLVQYQKMYEAAEANKVKAMETAGK